MIIALEKRENNLAEYILYMWQIEDIIRSKKFDLAELQASVINEFDVNLEVRLEIVNWYKNLIDQMKEEGIEEKGHLNQIKAEVAKLNRMHHQLLTVLQDKFYQDLYELAKENIDSLVAKSAGNIKSDVEACLVGLYGLMVLKLKKQKISQDTLEAMKSFSSMIAYLAKEYHKSLKQQSGLSKERNN